MPKVLITGFCEFPGANRASVQLKHVADALARDHTVDVLVVRRADQPYVEGYHTGRLLRVPTPEGDFKSRLGSFRRAVSRQLEGADYDIVHFRDAWSGMPVIDIARRHALATVYDVARSPLAEPLLLTPEEGVRMRHDHDACLAGADLVLAPHAHAQAYLSAQLASDKVKVVPPGVDINAFDWEPISVRGIPLLLYFGSLQEGRAIRVLLHGFREVLAMMPAALLLAGRATPEFAAQLSATIAELKLESSVHYAGERDHESGPSLIAQADVCIAPGALGLSAEPLELYPTKLLEYMACRRPVVAPATSTVNLLCKDEQHALLFQPAQPSDLATKVLRLLADPELSTRLAGAAYDHVRLEHTASRTRRLLHAAYEWMSALPKWTPLFAAAAVRQEAHSDFPVAPGATGAGGDLTWTSGIDRLSISYEGEVTGATAGVTDVTSVEPVPLAGGGLPSARALEEEQSLEWQAPAARKAPAPIDTRFVAGEFEVPKPSGNDARPERPATGNTVVHSEDD